MVAALFVLVLYAYHENADSRENIEYFAKHGLSHEFNGAHNVFVLNGPHTIQAHTATWRSLPHVAVLERSNTCYDFGAWGVGVEVAREKWKAKYTHYIILNASVRGPFLPLYARGDWWRVFVDQLGGASNVGLVGTTLNCWSSLAETHLQSMLLATHAAGFEQVMNWFLTCQESQTEAVSSGEIALSRAFLSHGFALQTLSLAFEDTIPRGGIVTPAAALGGGGFAEKRLYDLCVRLLAHNRHGGDANYAGEYGGIDVHPLEVVFVKSATMRNVSRDVIQAYTNWAAPQDAANDAAFDAANDSAASAADDSAAAAPEL
mmetsp:Transcript_11033/g.36877  ORF Transcript_11033/g.36877 Transcript_11033/m.36877 type:complete len:318 (-) Transcript_11033:30-983(-)